MEAKIRRGERGIAASHIRFHWVIPAVISLASVVVAMLGPEAEALLRYQADFDRGGEVWRLVTAHLVHLDWLHLLFNLLGLWLIWYCVGRAFNTDQWLLLIVLLAVLITLGLRIGSPMVGWYVGLSGLLYGVLSAGLVFTVVKGNLLGLVLLAFVILKAVVELLDMTTVSLWWTDQSTVTDAHVYGTAFGLLLGGVYRWICTARA